MSRITFRTLALILAALGAVLVLTAAPASAGTDGGTDGSTDGEEYPPPECSLSVDPEDAQAGDTITVSGTGWPPGAVVNVTIGTIALEPVTADEDGAWSFDYELPDSTPPGDIEVTADGCIGAESEVLSTTLTIGAAPAALPRTGSSNTEPLVRTAAVLIAAGAVLVYAVRRRNQAAAG